MRTVREDDVHPFVRFVRGRNTRGTPVSLKQGALPTPACTPRSPTLTDHPRRRVLPPHPPSHRGSSKTETSRPGDGQRGRHRDWVWGMDGGASGSKGRVEVGDRTPTRVHIGVTGEHFPPIRRYSGTPDASLAPLGYARREHLRTGEGGPPLGYRCHRDPTARSLAQRSATRGGRVAPSPPLPPPRPLPGVAKRGLQRAGSRARQAAATDSAETRPLTPSPVPAGGTPGSDRTGAGESQGRLGDEWGPGVGRRYLRRRVKKQLSGLHQMPGLR